MNLIDRLKGGPPPRDVVYILVGTKDEALANLFSSPGICLSIDRVLQATGIETRAGLKTAAWRLRPGIQLHIVRGEDLMVRES